MRFQPSSPATRTTEALPSLTCILTAEETVEHGSQCRGVNMTLRFGTTTSLNARRLTSVDSEMRATAQTTCGSSRITAHRHTKRDQVANGILQTSMLLH